MPHDEQLLDLLVRWDELREAGQYPTPEELCQDRPELLESFRRRLAEVQEFDVGLRVPTPSQAPPVDVTLALRYVDLRFHARGGLGEVLLATDAELGRRVALKCIQARYVHDSQAVNGFLVEAEVTSRLEHPGIVPVHGRGETQDGRPCYAMRFIEGETLKDAIERFHAADAPGRSRAERSLALRGLLHRFIALCNTIAYAHNRGILHRDIKPTNVMLGKYGETLVVDWGLAKPFTRDAAARSSGEMTLRPFASGSAEDTQLGDAKGTPAYMSPEQANGSPQHLSPGSDIFSLGAVLYAVLTGRAPYCSDNVMKLVAQARAGVFPAPGQVKKHVPRALEAICLKATAIKPEQRYATASELASDVEAWLADEPITAWHEPWRLRAARWMRRRQAVVVGIGAFLVLAAVSLTGALLLTEAWHKNQGAKEDVEYLLFIIDNFQAPVDLPMAEEQPPLDPATRERLRRGARRLLDDKQSPALTLGGEVTYRRLGDLCARHELFEEASGFYARVLDVRRKTLPAHHPDLLEALRRLADTHEQQGNLTDAEELLREHLAGCRRADEPDDRLLRQALFNLARLLERMKRPAEAERHYRECLESERRKLGPAGLETLTTLNRLGDLLEEYHQFEKAISLYQEWLGHLRALEPGDGRVLHLRRRLEQATSRK
jgi:serine/threonine-protein kinase